MSYNNSFVRLCPATTSELHFGVATTPNRFFFLWSTDKWKGSRYLGGPSAARRRGMLSQPDLSHPYGCSLWFLGYAIHDKKIRTTMVLQPEALITPFLRIIVSDDTWTIAGFR